jgi:hypothetical protein
VGGGNPLYKDRMADQTAPRTDCGGCTVCCTALPIEEFAKPSGITCRHCTATGCGIYETRYSICRTFLCGWLLMPQLDESWRPDRSGILIRAIDTDELPEEFRAAGTGMHFTLLGGEASIARPGFADYVATLVRRDVAVWLSADSPRTLINSYLKPAAMARSQDGVLSMLLHIYGLHVRKRQADGLKPLPWINPTS